LEPAAPPGGGPGATGGAGPRRPVPAAPAGGL